MLPGWSQVSKVPSSVEPGWPVASVDSALPVAGSNSAEGKQGCRVQAAPLDHEQNEILANIHQDPCSGASEGIAGAGEARAVSTAAEGRGSRRTCKHLQQVTTS